MKQMERLRALMRERRIDAYLVPTSDFHASEYLGEHFKCRQYLTGFTGSAGTLVVTGEEAGLWTDGRYFLQAERQLADTGVTLYRMGQPGVPTVEEFLLDRLPEKGVLGFDGRVVSEAFANQLAGVLDPRNITFSCQEDLAGMVWEDRPPLPHQPVWILEEGCAGVTAREKIAALRQEMEKSGATVHLMSALDEIAWLLNLRGDDIPCSPLFLSFALISPEKFDLFIQQEALSPQVRAYLEDCQVTIFPYASVYQAVAGLRGETVLLETQKVNHRMITALDPSNQVIDQMNPCAARKAIKNPVEIENMKRVHLEDGLAVTRFMYWLKHRDPAEPFTELDAAQKLEEFRRAQNGYLEPSFITIAAYGANAAMCHYRASREQNADILPRGLLLVDSGGQYYGGTTDITRTFAMGPLTEMEKEYFTIVSMAMLKVMDMKFLHGCRGINLDYTIREAFWKRGLDFNHGTGHGVSYMGSCHERPNGIRWNVVPERQDSAVIEPGMICSDEPGLYIDGVMGARTENLILCVPDEKNQYGQFLRFEFLTWVPIDLDAIDPRFMDTEDLRRLNQYHEEVYSRLSPLLPDEERAWLKQATRPLSGHSEDNHP